MPMAWDASFLARPTYRSSLASRARSSLFGQVCAEMPEVPLRIAGAVLAGTVIGVVGLDDHLRTGTLGAVIIVVDFRSVAVSSRHQTPQFTGALQCQHRYL